MRSQEQKEKTEKEEKPVALKIKILTENIKRSEKYVKICYLMFNCYSFYILLTYCVYFCCSRVGAISSCKYQEAEQRRKKFVHTK